MATPAEVNNFYVEGMHNLNKLGVGEHTAKVSMLVNMIMGESILLIGPPGGLKTKLAGNAYRVVEGIEPHHLATIPPSAELSATQLVGGFVESQVETHKEGDDKPTVEVKRTRVEPIIRPDTKVLWANEINRMNPFGLNAAMEAYADGTIATPGGVVTLDGLEYGVSTMNPGASKFATFSVDPAMASRHTMGIELGRPKSEDGRREIIDAIKDGFSPQPEKIEPVIDLRQLHEMREEAFEIPIPADLDELAYRSVSRTTDLLRIPENGNIDEADGRIATQIFGIAKAIAYLGSQERVQPKDLKFAVVSSLTARLGALTVVREVNIPQLAERILSE